MLKSGIAKLSICGQPINCGKEFKFNYYLKAMIPLGSVCTVSTVSVLAGTSTDNSLCSGSINNFFCSSFDASGTASIVLGKGTLLSSTGSAWIGSFKEGTLLSSTGSAWIGSFEEGTKLSSCACSFCVSSSWGSNIDEIDASSNKSLPNETAVCAGTTTALLSFDGNVLSTADISWSGS